MISRAVKRDNQDSVMVCAQWTIMVNQWWLSKVKQVYRVICLVNDRKRQYAYAEEYLHKTHLTLNGNIRNLINPGSEFEMFYIAYFVCG